jgi:hypothetical protein
MSITQKFGTIDSFRGKLNLLKTQVTKALEVSVVVHPLHLSTVCVLRSSRENLKTLNA